MALKNVKKYDANPIEISFLHNYVTRNEINNYRANLINLS